MEQKNNINYILVIVSFFGSIASIIGLLLPIPALEFVKDIQNISNGFIALTIFVFMGLLALVVILNDRTHAKYHSDLEGEISNLNNDLKKFEKSDKKYTEILNTNNKNEKEIDRLTTKTKIQAERLKDYTSLENELLGLFKSGKPLSANDLRNAIDEKVTTSDINIALSALDSKIMATSPNSRTSEYVINNA